MADFEKLGVFSASSSTTPEISSPTPFVEALRGRRAALDAQFEADIAAVSAQAKGMMAC